MYVNFSPASGFKCTDQISRNPDVLVCVDGNFQHRRWSNILPDPEILSLRELAVFLTQDELDAAQKHVDESRGRTALHPRPRMATAVPSGALDELRDSHHAAQERADDEDSGKYASKGFMAMVCRHDVPLFLCDTKTPGERQFFAIALIRKVASLLPILATIGILYDIGCQTDRSIALVSIIPDVSSVARSLQISFAARTTSRYCPPTFLCHLGLSRVRSPVLLPDGISSEEACRIWTDKWRGKRTYLGF